MTDVRTQPDGWMVVWTESRAEKKVASRLGDLGVDYWLPTMTERHRWSDRWRIVVLPLFPGYLFARTSASDLPRLLRTPGVLTVVKAGGQPAALSDQFVVALRAAVENPLTDVTPVAEPQDYTIEDEVVVKDGPLAGLRGVVKQLRGARHLTVWVREIGRGVSFTIGTERIARCAPPRSTCVVES